MNKEDHLNKIIWNYAFKDQNFKEKTKNSEKNIFYKTLIEILQKMSHMIWSSLIFKEVETTRASKGGCLWL
jgi:hypothetical protein